MDMMFTYGAGLDVHKKTVMACRVIPDPTGQQEDDHRDLARQERVAEVGGPADLQHCKGERDLCHPVPERVDRARPDEQAHVALAQSVSHGRRAHRPTRPKPSRRKPTSRGTS